MEMIRGKVVLCCCCFSFQGSVSGEIVLSVKRQKKISKAHEEAFVNDVTLHVSDGCSKYY